MQVTRKNIVVSVFILTVIGLVWSRALLSITTGLWLMAGLLMLRTKQISIKPNPLFVWSVSSLALFLLGLWQSPFDKANYDLLLSWAAYPAIGVGVIVIRACGAAVVCKKIWIYGAAIAALYPILWLLFHFTNALALIKIGKSIPVFMDNDHLRFSMYLASALLLSFSIENKKSKQILIAFFITAILLLSVRTGIVLAVVVVIGQLLNHRNVRTSERQHSDDPTTRQPDDTTTRRSPIVYGLWSIVFLLSLFLLSQKLNYTLYDYQQFSTKGYDPNYSDGVRRAINHASWLATENTFFTGVGWSQINPTLQNYFYQEYHQPSPFGWPFSQYLFWMLGAGIAGLACFTAWLLFPIWLGWKTKQKAIVIWSIAMAVSCLVESNLSFQFGIALHAFTLLLAAENIDYMRV